MKSVVALLVSASAFISFNAKAGIRTEDSANQLVVAAEHPTAALVLFPGAYLDAKQYSSLAEDIVLRSSGDVAVFVPHFTGKIANPLESQGRVQAAIDFLRSEGVAQPNTRVFVGGHSEGGIIATLIPESLKLPGLILLGSYLPHTIVIGKQLSTYPIPTLTLGGELDGLTGLNYLAREFATLQLLAAKDASVFGSKPVVVLPGVSHMQFADGAALQGDSIKPEQSLAASHQAMAEVIVDFMAVQTRLSGVESQVALKALKGQVAATQTLLLPYALASSAEPKVCSDLQKAATPWVDTQAWDRINIESKIYRHGPDDLAFILDKSSVAQDGQFYTLHLPVLIDDEVDVADVSTDHFLSPRSLFCKMRTAAKLAEETGFAVQQSGLNCAELNAKVIVDTLATLTNPQQRARLAAKYGDMSTWTSVSTNDDTAHSLQLGPLRIRSTREQIGPKWVFGGFSFGKAADNTWHLDTVELVTGNEGLGKFAGANYCKVIAPARVVEWATVFGLK